MDNTHHRQSIEIAKMITISSQRHIDLDIVQDKLDDEDFVVTVSPVFIHDGLTLRVVLDGHHSLEAAKLAGVEPDFVEQNASQNDRIALLNKGQFDDFLAATYMDSDYYDVVTGKTIW